MIIIVEYVILNNFILDFIICAFTTLFIFNKVLYSNCIIASIIGTVSAILFPLINAGNIIILLLKIIIGIAMSLILSKTNNIKKIFLLFIAFFSVTAAMGGIAILIYFLIYSTANLNSFTINSSTYPLWLFYLTIFIYSLLLFKLANYFKCKKIKNNFIFNTIIRNTNVEMKTNAFLDSGNILLDPDTKSPIIIIGLNTFMKLYPNIQLEKILLKQISKEDIITSKYIKVSTLGYLANEMLVFKIDRLEIALEKHNKVIENIYAGLSLTKFQQQFNCDILLNPYCFSDGGII